MILFLLGIQSHRVWFIRYNVCLQTSENVQPLFVTSLVAVTNYWILFQQFAHSQNAPAARDFNSSLAVALRRRAEHKRTTIVHVPTAAVALPPPSAVPLWEKTDTFRLEDQADGQTSSLGSESLDFF